MSRLTMPWIAGRTLLPIPPCLSAPSPVPYGVVEALIDYLDESGACRFDRALVVGQTVRVIAGPLTGAIGQLVRLDGRGRVRVLLEILSGQVYAKLERSALEAG